MFIRLVVAAAGAALARAALSAATSSVATSQRSLVRGLDLNRTNYRGRTVSLAGGPVLATAATTAAAGGALVSGSARLAAACAVAGVGAGAVGLYDDLAGARPGQAAAKGFRGHLGALRRGHVTSGLVKIVGVGAAGYAAAAVLPRRRRGRVGRAAEVALGAGVIAGTANLVNLLDLRPGRALKAGLIAGVPLAAAEPYAAASHAARSGAAGTAAAGAVGAAAALLPEDLGERVMLGDCGANAFGALLGVAAAERSSLTGRAALLAGIMALTAASEKVSFTAVIEGNPVLRRLDQLGRGR